MLDLYFWTTNNGYRARTMVEETGLAYNLHPISLPKLEQLSEDYKKLHIGHKIPVLVDSDGPGGRVVIPESPAILRYLAAKTNSALIPKDARTLVEMETWFSYGIATFCPILAQHGYFNFRSSEDVPGAKKYYEIYARDLYDVINQRLDGRDYFVGDRISLADYAHYADVRQYAKSYPPGDYPNIKAWYDRVSARPAVQRAYAPI
jgi:GST-like protein